MARKKEGEKMDEDNQKNDDSGIGRRFDKTGLNEALNGGLTLDGGSHRKWLRNSIKAEFISWAKTIILAVAFALCINNFVIVNAAVPTGSMENNIMPNDRLVAFRLSYLFSEPQRYDVVIFPFPDDESTLFVKRIIGLPGETIEIVNGKVFVDGTEHEPLKDDFIKEEMYGNFGPYVVPEGQYFMLGDNRNFSKDSRFWEHKFVEKKKILGKVVLKYYPGFKLFGEME